MRALIISLFFVLFHGVSEAQDTPLKLYTFDCGAFYVDNFSSTGEYDGTESVQANGCFLIRHSQGDLLWDLGLSASLVGRGRQIDNQYTVSLDKTLVEQLAEIKLHPEDIEFVSISHNHFDHIAQIAPFSTSTWLVDENELMAMQEDGDFKDQFADFTNLDRKIFNSDYDVFGDGSVMIIQTPGHTVGHTILQVNLMKTGMVLLSGDLYDQTKARELKLVPSYNFDEAQTRQSFDRFEKLAAELDAKVIIQHESADIGALPKLPNYLQ